MSKPLLLLEVIFVFCFKNSGVICCALFINQDTSVVMGQSQSWLRRAVAGTVWSFKPVCALATRLICLRFPWGNAVVWQLWKKHFFGLGLDEDMSNEWWSSPNVRNEFTHDWGLGSLWKIIWWSVGDQCLLTWGCGLAHRRLGSRPATDNGCFKGSQRLGVPSCSLGQTQRPLLAFAEWIWWNLNLSTGSQFLLATLKVRAACPYCMGGQDPDVSLQSICSQCPCLDSRWCL